MSRAIAARILVTKIMLIWLIKFVRHVSRRACSRTMRTLSSIHSSCSCWLSIYSIVSFIIDRTPHPGTYTQTHNTYTQRRTHTTHVYRSHLNAVLLLAEIVAPLIIAPASRRTPRTWYTILKVCCNSRRAAWGSSDLYFLVFDGFETASCTTALVLLSPLFRLTQFTTWGEWYCVENIRSCAVPRLERATMFFNSLIFAFEFK